jgi:ABC-type uncharacterized transport system substrate-binding protein
MKNLWLGLILIVAASSVLLVSDWAQRSTGGPLKRIALVQHASQAALDESVQGILKGLAAQGAIDGKTVTIERFNAENDIGTANAIARQVVNGGFDLIVTSSTLSLQTVAAANQAGRVKHVFGISADPFSAGVGISRENPLNHPKHMTGIGLFIPVSPAFQLARELYPGLKKVGMVWNSAESNSAAYTKSARAAARDLGIQLLEANAENSSAVLEASSSLVSRGAEALFISGDVTVLVGADSVVTAAKRGRIPVFSIIPPNVQKGAMFDLGANYVEAGEQVGELAGKVLNGTDPATVPVLNVVPGRLAVNQLAFAGLRDSWRLPKTVLDRAQIIVDEKGQHGLAAKTVSAAPVAGRKFKLGIVYFAPEEGADLVIKGLFKGFAEQGIEEGKNLEVKRAHAQGEIANIPTLLQNSDNQGLDLIVTLTTPCLTAACSVVRNTPVLFTYVYDPIAAGAGTSRQSHLAHVTGVGSFPPVADTIALIQKLVPGVKSVGTLYNSSEANSRKVVSVARDLFTQRGIKLEEVTVTGTSEILQAAQVVTHRNVQALWVTGDNTALQGFDAIVKAARDAKLPLIINDPEFTARGALAAVGLGWYESGHAAGTLGSRILKGESPRNLPFEEIAVKKLTLNHDVAKQLGITFPADLLKEAAR